MKKRNLLMMFVAIFGIATSTLAQVPSYVPSNGLLGWWPFNGNANDESGNGNNGTVNGAALVLDKNFISNSAYNFNGSSTINFSNQIIPSNGSFTISFWVKPNTISGVQEFMSQNFWPSAFYIGMNGGNLRCGDYWQSTGIILASQIWQHFVIVRDYQNDVSIYKNGILQKTLGSDITLGGSNTDPLVFGKQYGSNAEYYNGILDDIGIFNRILTPSEVSQLYIGCGAQSYSITPQGSTTFCNGGFVSLAANTGTGFNYQWFLNGSPINNSNFSSYIATQSGNYTVEVNDNGCKALSSPVLVTVNNPPSNVVNASGPTTFCSGNSITLTAQGSGTYLWNTGATTQSINVSQAGSYSVTVTANTCSSNSQAIQVTVNTTPLANITPSGPTSFCSGGFVTLTASGGGTYQWNTGSNASAITVNQMGNFVVTVAANGCTANASQQVTVNPSPNVSLSSPGSFIILSASPVVLSGSPSGGIYAGSGVGANMFYPANAGLGQHTLSYTYTNNFGCIGSATQSTLVYDTLQCSVSTTDTLFIKVAVVGITPPNNISTIKVFPNPTNDHITIDYGNYLILNGYTMKITNSLGQLVYVSPVNQASQFLSLASWGGSGLYYVYLLDPQNNTVSVKEIVLQ